MKISALRFHNVKRFAGRGVAIEGIGDGVNVLCAPNEFGKSTSFEALQGLFLLPHSSTAGDVRNLRPYSGGNPLIEADVSLGEKRYRIAKRFYGGRFARVIDADTGRIIAQADEAEALISQFVNGGSSGPTGLLWVRQGITGMERRPRGEEEGEAQVRTNLLESVQGEVEAVTGGRRMAEIMGAASEALGALVTPTGRPRAGGRYAVAIDERDLLASKEQQLARSVIELQGDLDARTACRKRFDELDDDEERRARRAAIEAAEAALTAARAGSERAKASQATFDLAKERHGTTEEVLRRFVEALTEAAQLEVDSDDLLRRRAEAVTQRGAAIEAIELARGEIEAAETEAGEAEELLARLERCRLAEEGAERRAELQAVIKAAEGLRADIESLDAQIALVSLPEGAIDELAELDVEIARFKAVRDAGRPSVRAVYDVGAKTRMTIDGEELPENEARSLDLLTEVKTQGIGSLIIQANASTDIGSQLEDAETRRGTMLASMGVRDLGEARERQARARDLDGSRREARAKFATLVPDGFDVLRETLAALPEASAGDPEPSPDPEEVRLRRAAAQERRRIAAATVGAKEPARIRADEAFVAAETELAKLATRREQVTATLGPVEDRDDRHIRITSDLVERQSALDIASRALEDARRDGADVESAEASLRRVRSVEDAVESEKQDLREKLAGMNARIAARSDEAVEEDWREISEALEAAEARVAAFEREAALLSRLSEALERARSNARDLYLRPVMDELRPLLGLLFDDVSVTFDERTLLPQTIMRDGQEEEVQRLSGGMREQLSILTRLAFSRLLAQEGNPAPVVLDDALVYSDDDRIERMFDALHRQARDQQILVFSCRQRAFQRLGGNLLRMTDWTPDPALVD